MIYRSNLTCPDLRPFFKLKDPPVQICGHDIPSDPDFEPGCGYWSEDEAAILYNVAKQVGGSWVDIGSRFGWTGAHLVSAGCNVVMVDPIYNQEIFMKRTKRNLESLLDRDPWNPIAFAANSSTFFTQELPPDRFDGFVIDGNHDSPEPLTDAINAAIFAAPGSVIMFHDVWGKPIRDGINYLMKDGYQCRIYNTPNGVACCWRGLPDFAPPDHIPDPAIDWNWMRRQFVDLDFTRCV